MTQGGLQLYVVHQDFWPACDNCHYYDFCRQVPLHRAFPHNWHWGKETVQFADGTMLVLKSWVGSSVIGAPHTGCTRYRVAQDELLTFRPHHTRWLELEMRRQFLEMGLNRLEGGNRKMEDEINAILKEQQELTRGENTHGVLC